MLCLSDLAARAEEADALIAKGDQFDQRLQAKEALEVYLPANKLEPNNVKLLVCIARQYRHLMSDTSSKQEKLRLGNISLEFASRAATLAPNNAEAQLSPAISLGKMLPFMGRDLMKHEPVFREAIEKCDAALRPWASFSLLEELGRSEEKSQMHRTEIGQPSIFAMQIALAALWKSWGVEPSAIVGHSVGEIAAACVAGIFSDRKSVV